MLAMRSAGLLTACEKLAAELAGRAPVVLPKIGHGALAPAKVAGARDPSGASVCGREYARRLFDGSGADLPRASAGVQVLLEANKEFDAWLEELEREHPSPPGSPRPESPTSRRALAPTVAIPVQL